jgi:hypothetical protein
MSVLLISQAGVNLCPLYSFVNIENVMDDFVQTEDDCEEDVLIAANASAFDLTLEKYFLGILSSYSLRMPPSIWQPPK